MKFLIIQETKISYIPSQPLQLALQSRWISPQLLLLKCKTVQTMKYIYIYVYICVYVYVFVYMDFPGGLDGKESPWNVGDLCLIPGLGRSPGEGHSNPLQYSCLENPHGQRSLVDYSLWGRKESDRTMHISSCAHARAHTHTHTHTCTHTVTYKYI